MLPSYRRFQSPRPSLPARGHQFLRYSSPARSIGTDRICLFGSKSVFVLLEDQTFRWAAECKCIQSDHAICVRE